MVLLLATAVAMIAFSLLSTTSNSARITERHVARLQAESTAEALLEYGVAQLADQLEMKTSFTDDELQPGNSPLVIPDSAAAFFADTNIDISSLELRAGVLPSGDWEYISPVDLLYEYDELAGKIVFARAVELYSKATVAANGGGDVTVYLNETFVVRDAPLFTNAIFYNSDLEFNPGYDTDVVGPVHTNGNLEVGANSGYDLVFKGKVTSAQEIFRNDNSGDVYFPSSFDPLTLAKMIQGGSALDSDSSDWLEDSTDRWNGFVQDVSMGVKPQSVVAFNEYTPDDPNTAENERDNSAYALIEPLLPSGHADRKNESVRNQKMAYKAGLVIKLEPGGVLKGYAPVRSNSSNALSPVVLDSNGDVTYTEVTLPADLIGDPDSSFTSIENNRPEYYNNDVVTTTETYTYTTGKGKNKETVTGTREVTTDSVIGGLYDHRENRGVDTVALDMERLKHYIDSKDNSGTGFDGTFDVESQWNGVVYVEFPTSLSTTDGVYDYGTATNDYHIVPAVDSEADTIEMALMLIDAKEVPEPTNVAEPGFTLATNAPTYLVGSYNADGSPHTSDSTEPDDSSEQPAAILADSITLLSDDWPSNRANSNVDGRSNIESDRPASSYIEIAAALVTGTPNALPSGASYPTTDASRPNSLGVINLPRFLEYWGSSRTVTIRGSLVSLFESEVRPDGAPSNFNDYYVPPTRDWGYNTLFSEGRFPPGTPVIRNFRRINFSNITKSEYDAAIQSLDDL
ncbi:MULTISPECIES: hypothetical protein [unclassified Lentimonas]|uniref:hypothetical protein n=1 Tax=unclassified Lentimonas TaxID=2630993 RepID=UPI00138A1574|nr:MULTISPECIES: hypothetical protein [unclassified Lentimonas]